MAGATGSRAGQTADAAVDVVVPVYNAPDELARCVESVLLHTEHPHRLVLIDDGSTDPAVAAYFAAMERRALPNVLLLRNRRNRGFPATANRGMGLSRADVVLLNSDTLVTKGWLEALARCAASGPDIGTVTPFSNNAEICSFPRFCENNAPGDGGAAEAVRAALARAAVPTYPSLPTGVGFCFYIRRELIDAIGVFDVAFGPGYGEENDFCMRALEAGYRSVLCDDAYVLHLGGRSFAGRKSDLGVRNTALLLERHPRYAEIVREFIAGDPLRPLRDAALAQHRASTGSRHGVLHVLQSLGGGTERQVRVLIGASRALCRHYMATAEGDDWRVEEDLDDGAVRAYGFRRLPGESWPAFLGGIAATFRIGVVHVHNISGCRDGIIDALAGLDLPYGYTVHDLDFACPTITFLGADGMYCGAVTDTATCARCLGARTRFAGIDIAAWRARHRDLVARSAFLMAPSHWAASTLSRYFPGRRVGIVPHGLPQGNPADRAGTGCAPRTAVALPDDDTPTVAVLGAIGPDKGARRLERMVDLVRATGTRVRFVLIGYLDVRRGPWQSDDAALTIHGQYDPLDLPGLLDHYRVKLVAFPSAGPETFSLTLSEAWAAGRPAIVPPFGALAERVGTTGAGWLWTDDEWRSEEAMLARIAGLVAPGSGDALDAAARRARALPQPTANEMARQTLACYDAACAAGTSLRLPPLSAARVRDALGYVPWSLPVVPVATPAPASHVDARGRLLGALQRLRRTLPGRALSRLTPARVREAMKRRLS